MNTVKVELESPIEDGSKTLTSLTIYKATVMQLQNINIHKLLQFDSSEWTMFLPCLCKELETCVDKLDVADFLYIMQEAATFFIKKSQLEKVESMKA